MTYKRSDDGCLWLYGMSQPRTFCERLHKAVKGIATPAGLEVYGFGFYHTDGVAICYDQTRVSGDAQEFDVTIQLTGQNRESVLAGLEERVENSFSEADVKRFHDKMLRYDRDPSKMTPAELADRQAMKIIEGV